MPEIEGGLTKVVPLYGPDNQILRMVEKNYVPALDPYFFFTTAYRGNISADEIERKPYQYHPWTHAAAWAIIRNLTGLPVKLRDRKTKKFTDSDKSGILKLLNTPNPFMTRTTFLQTALLYMLLPGSGSKNNRKDMPGGQCFLLPSPPDLGSFDFHSGKVPDQLYPYSSDTVRVKLKKDSNLAEFEGWQIFGKSRKELIVKNEHLIRIGFANPYDWFQGMSKSEPAIIAMTADIKSDIYNVKFYDNSGVPSGIIKMEKPMTKEQRREWLANFNEEFAGSAGGNNSRTAMLPQGMTYEKIGVTAADMQFIEAKNDAFEKLLACYGLNKIAIGKYEDITYNTIEIGRKFLWQDGYMPVGDMFWEQFDSRCGRYLDAENELCFDYSGVEALQPDFTKQAGAAKIFVDMGMPVEMACRMNRIQISEEDLKASPWLKEKPERVSPISFQGMGNVDGEQKPKLPPPEKQLTVIKGMPGMDYDARRKYQDDYQDKVGTPLERIYQDKITRFFIGQRNRMQDKVDAWLAKNTRKTMKAASDPQLDQFLLEKDAEDKRAAAVVQQLLAQQINVGMNRMDEEMGGIDWGKVDPLTHKYSLIERLAMEDINTTTFNVARDKIGEAITQAVDENMTAQEAAKLIKDSVGDVFDIRRNQAMTIARTETGKIQSGLRFDVYRDEGIEYTMWITANDERVRDSHMMADGEIRRIGIPFSMGLLYPLQSGGPAEEVINCFPGEMIAYSEDIEGAYKSLYKGEVISINMASGHKLTGTPNHPILTQRGFVPLYLIQPGDNVLSCGFNKWESLYNMDIKNAPSGIEKKFNSFINPANTMRVSRSIMNFYGDIPASDVDIVDIKGFLLNDIKSSVMQNIRNKILALTNKRIGASKVFAGNSLFNTIGNNSFTGQGSKGFIGGGSTLVQSFGGHSGHAQNIGLTSISDIASAPDQAGTDSTSFNSKFFRNRQFGKARVVKPNRFSFSRIGSAENRIPGSIGLASGPNNNSRAEQVFFNSFSADPISLANSAAGKAGLIKFDKVLHTDLHKNFKGYVYTLQTTKGIYLINGTIARNCRCVAGATDNPNP